MVQSGLRVVEHLAAIKRGRQGGVVGQFPNIDRIKPA